MKQHLSILLAALGLLLVPATPAAIAPQEAGTGPVPSGPGETPGVPCFESAEGRLLFRIEGVPAHEGALKQYVEIFRHRHPRASLDAVTRRAIEEGMIPVAAMYAAHRDEVDALSRRAAEAIEKLESGIPFKDVVLSDSDDPNRSINFGSEGIRVREAFPGLQPLSAALEGKAFSIPEGTWSAPFATPLGIEIAFASNEKPTADPKSPGAVQREVFRILFSWNAEYGSFLRNYDRTNPTSADRLRAFKARSQEIIESARVEVVEAEFAKHFFPYRLKKR